MVRYRVVFGGKFEKELKKLDTMAARRIAEWIRINLVDTDDPWRYAKAMRGEYEGMYRYRIGDYRVIVKIEQEEVAIICLTVGHRREVYR